MFDMSAHESKAVHTISVIGHVLRYATPLMLMLIGYTYIRDQDVQRERHELLVDKVSVTQSTIREIDDELEDIGKILAKRGVQLENLEEENDSHYFLINDHEARIRNLELAR